MGRDAAVSHAGDIRGGFQVRLRLILVQNLIFPWITGSSVARVGPRGSRQHRQGDSASLALQNGHRLLVSDTIQALAVHG